MPAMSAWCRESLPRVAETSWLSIWFRVTGRAPVLITRARSLASWIVKLPGDLGAGALDAVGVLLVVDLGVGLHLVVEHDGEGLADAGDLADVREIGG